MRARIGILLLGCAAALAGGEAEKTWPSPVEGHRPPAAGEHPRLLFREADIAALRKRAKTPAGEAMIARLKLLLGGGEALPTWYQAATQAYDSRKRAEAEAEQEKVTAGGASLAGSEEEEAEDLGLDELLAEGEDDGDAEGEDAGIRPPWAEAGMRYAFEDLPLGAYTCSHAAGFAFLWVLTEDPTYAELARRCVELAYAGQRDRDDRYAWKNPGGMLRAGPAIACYALAYDLAYDAWNEDFRRDFALRIQDYAMETGETMEALCLKPRMVPTSNHYGMQVGGATLAMLAIKDDPGTDPATFERYLAGLTRNTHALFDKGFGSKGYHREGHHPTRMTAAWMMPALRARRLVLGEDWVTGNANAEWLCTRWLYEVVRQGETLHCNMYGRYPDPHFVRGGMNGGDFAQGLGLAPRAHLPAIKWFVEHVIDPGPLPERDWDAVEYPHRAVQMFVNWPIDLEARNPAEVLPGKVLLDYRKGHVVFRNGWHEDPDADMVVSCSIGTLPGYGGIDRGGPVMMIGRGRKLVLPCNLYKASTVSRLQAGSDGSGSLSVTVKNTYVAVDYSGRSGADAVVVMCGRGIEEDHLTVRPTAVHELASGWRLYVVTLQEGEPPAMRVEGDVLHIGEQTVTWHDGYLEWGTIADPEILFLNEGHLSHPKDPPEPPEVVAARRAAERTARLRELLAAAEAHLAAGEREAARAELQTVVNDGKGTPEGKKAKGILRRLAREAALEGIE